MTLGEVGTCGNDSCRQTDVLAEDGYCSATCRQQATGCEVSGCTCAGGCDRLDRPPTVGRSP